MGLIGILGHGYTSWQENTTSVQSTAFKLQKKYQTYFPLCSDGQFFTEVRKCRDSHKQSDLTDMWLASAYTCCITLATMSGSCWVRMSCVGAFWQRETITPWTKNAGIPQLFGNVTSWCVKSCKPVTYSLTKHQMKVQACTTDNKTLQDLER